MTALVRTELLKLRTTRVPLVLLVVTLAVTVAVTAMVLNAPPEAFDLTGAERILPLAQLSFLHVFSFGLGIVMLAGEYRHRTIRQTLLVTPVRGKVLTAKLIAALVPGLVLGVLATVVALAIGAVWLTSRGVDVSLAARELLLAVLGSLGVMTLSAPLGVAVAAVIPRQSAAVIAYLLWLQFGKGAIDRWLPTVTRYLPDEALLAFGRDPYVYALEPVPVWAGGVIVLAYIAAFSLLGNRVVLRRDIP